MENSAFTVYVRNKYFRNGHCMSYGMVHISLQKVQTDFISETFTSAFLLREDFFVIQFIPHLRYILHIAWINLFLSFFLHILSINDFMSSFLQSCSHIKSSFGAWRFVWRHALLLRFTYYSVFRKTSKENICFKPRLGSCFGLHLWNGAPLFQFLLVMLLIFLLTTVHMCLSPDCTFFKQFAKCLVGYGALQVYVIQGRL